MNREAAATLIEMAGIKMDLDKLKEGKYGKMEYKMCKAFQEITQEAREEGYKDGVDANTHASVTVLMETMNLSLEQALDALKITGERKYKF